MKVKSYRSLLRVYLNIPYLFVKYFLLLIEEKLNSIDWGVKTDAHLYSIDHPVTTELKTERPTYISIEPDDTYYL